MKSTKNPTRLARLAIAWTWAFFATRLVTIATMTVNLLALSAWVPENFPYLAFAQLTKWSAWGSIGVQFVAGVLSLAWIYRVSRNAGVLAGGLPISPGWAVGCPVGAFWKPFEALEQAWRASLSPMAWRSAPTPALLRWWWTFWIGAGVVSGIFGFLGQIGVKSQTFASVMLILISGLVLVQCVLFVRVMRGLTSLQVSADNLDVFD